MERYSAIIWREIHDDLNSKVKLLMYVSLIAFSIYKLADYGGTQSIYNVSTGVFLISIFSIMTSCRNIEVMLALPLNIWDFCMAKTIYIMIKVIVLCMVEFIISCCLLKIQLLYDVFVLIECLMGIYSISIFIENISLLFKKNYKFILLAVLSFLLFCLKIVIFEVDIKLISITIIILSVILSQYLSFIISKNMDKEKLIKRSI